MESSRLHEHGSRLPASWDGGGTMTARGRGCPGAGRTVQVAERPQGGEEKTVPPQWGQGIPCQTRGS